MRPRVLIVDDQPLFRRVAREVLDARGYTVVGEASCAASALEAAERLGPDAVLLDVRLGDDSGYAVARALAELEPSAGGAAGLGRMSDGDEDERACACGACGFLPQGPARSDRPRALLAGHAEVTAAHAGVSVARCVSWPAYRTSGSPPWLSLRRRSPSG